MSFDRFSVIGVATRSLTHGQTSSYAAKNGLSKPRGVTFFPIVQILGDKCQQPY